MAHCPNINNTEVRNKFNSIVTTFNGTPLSIEEFKSVELRDKREGNDLTAMNIAYSVWNKTMGKNIPVTQRGVIDLLKENNQSQEIKYNSQGEVLAPNGNVSKLAKDIEKLEGVKNKEQAFQLYKQTRSKEFKDWFGDSKVVDENGEPLMVYHSSPEKFDTFTTTNLKNTVNDRLGIHRNFVQSGAFFSTNKGMFNYGDNVYPVFLNMRNEVKVQHEREINNIIKELNIWGGVGIQIHQDFYYTYRKDGIYFFSTTLPESLMLELKKRGYDGYVRLSDFEDLLNTYGFFGEDNLMYLSEFLSLSKEDIINHPYFKNFTANDQKNLLKIKELSDLEVLEYVVFEPNQIKSVFNQGEFSKENNNIYKQEQVTQPEIDSVLQEFANDLSNRFNIPFELISEEEAKKANPNYNGEPAFFNPKTNKAYLVKGKANKTSAIHEIFTHPFLLQIEKTNPELYANLLKEAKSNKDVVDYVNNNYKGTNQHTLDHEYIARAIDLYAQNELDQQKDKGLITRIKELFAKLSDYLKKLFNIPEVFSNNISLNITLRQLTQFAMYGKSKMYLNISKEEVNKTLKVVNILTNLNSKQQQEWNKLDNGEITIEEFVDNIGKLTEVNKELDVKLRQELNNISKQLQELFKNKKGNTEEANKLKEKQKELKQQLKDNEVIEVSKAIGIPKKQKQLIIDSYRLAKEIDVPDLTPKDIAMDIASKYNYSVEIKTAKSKGIYNMPYNEEDNQFEPDFDEEGIPIKESDIQEGLPTQHYSNLTVPGGTNYTENRIITPQITPNIRGHAQFAENEDIGWFRSDDQAIGKQNIPSFNSVTQFKDEYNTIWSKENGVWYMQLEGEDAVERDDLTDADMIAIHPNKEVFNQYSKDGQSTKTRRILELQSDLFQKWRNNFTFHSIKYSIKKSYNNNHYWKGGIEITANEYIKDWNKFLDTFDSTEDVFIKLLQKKNNWVTFFVKSIIQDSAKKGYEKVLFPKGETAAKVEGHETIAEKIRRIDKDIDKVKQLDIDKQNLDEMGFPKLILGFTIESEAKRTEVIKQLIKDKENIKSQGIEKLKPIEAFYEIKVGNILEKQFGKDNVKTITDEFGNQWREIDLSNKKIQKETENIYYQNNINQSEQSKTNSNNLPTQISQTYFKGEASQSVQTMLNIVKTPLSKKLLSILKSNNIKDNVTVGLAYGKQIKYNKGVYVYDSKSENIYIGLDTADSLEDAEQTIIHEILHYTTVQLLATKKEIAEEWKDFYAKVSLFFTEEELAEYNIKDEAEFLSEVFTNKELQIALSKKRPILSADQKAKYKNLWEEVWAGIISLLGINEKDSLFKEAFALGTHVVEQGIEYRNADDFKLTPFIAKRTDQKANKILNYVGELDRKGNVKLHKDTNANKSMLHQKAIRVNKAQHEYIARVGYSEQRIKGYKKLPLVLHLYPLTEKESILRKYNLINIDGNGKKKLITMISTKTNKQILSKHIDNINNNENDWIAVFKDNGNTYSIEIEPNVRKIDNYIGAITNNYVNSNNVVVSNQHKDSVEWKNMISKLGNDTALKIYKLNKQPLTAAELEEYINKLDDYNPNPLYMQRFDPSTDDSDIEWDNASMYEEEPENTDTQEIIDDIKDILKNVDISSLNLDLDEDVTKEDKNMINHIFLEFENKLKLRIKLLNDNIASETDDKRIIRLKLQRNELYDIIRNTEDENKNLWQMLDIMENDFNKIANAIKTNTVRIKDIRTYNDTLSLWNMIIKDWQSNTNNDLGEYLRNSLAFQKSLIYYKGVLAGLQNELLIKSKRLVLDSLNKVSNTKMNMSNLDKIKDINTLQKEFLDLSRTGETIVTSVYKLLNNAENKKARNFNAFSKELEDKLQKLKAKHDFSKKETQRLFLEEDEDGNLTTNLVSDYTYEFYKIQNELKRLQEKLLRSRNINVIKSLSNDIRKLQKQNVKFIGLSTLVSKTGLLLVDKVEDLRNMLLKSYDEDYVNKIINEVISKYNNYLEEASLKREQILEKVKTHKDYHKLRVKGKNETTEDVNKRLQMEADSLFNKWEMYNNPIKYLENLSKSNGKLKHSGYKYLAFIPNDEHFSKKMEAIKKDKDLYEFYKFYKENLNKYLNYLPEHKTENLLENFLPYNQKTLLEQIKSKNDTISSIQSSLITNSTVSESVITKQVDILGEEINKIPIRYLNLSLTDIDIIINLLHESNHPNKEEKIKKLKKYKEKRQNNFDTDIVKTLRSFALMAENFNSYNEIEDTVLAAKNAIDNITNVISSKKIKQEGNKNEYAVIQEGAKNIKELLDYTIKSMMYDESKEHRSVIKRKFYADKEERKLYKKYNKELKVLEQKQNQNEIESNKIKKRISDLRNNRTIPTSKDELKTLQRQYNQNKAKKIKYIIERDKIERKIANLGDGRVVTTDTLVNNIINVTGFVNLGYNVKAAINNYLFGKVSLIIHSTGKEDFDREELKRAFAILNKSMMLGFEASNPLNNKIRVLSEKFNVAFEVNEAAYGVETLNKKERKNNPLKPYWMTRKGEYYLQNAGLIAILLHNTIDVKNEKGEIYQSNYFDIYDDNGHLRTDLKYKREGTDIFEDTIEGLDENVSALESNKLTKITDQVAQLNTMIHGNYDPRHPMKFKSKDYGRVLMQYKTWMPEGWMLKFEKEHSDDMLGRIRKGRYRTINDIGIINSGLILLKGFLNKNNIKKEDFKKSVDYANMLKNLNEFRFIVAMTIGNLILMSVLMGMRGDDDDENKMKLMLSTANQLARLNGDLKFYFSPSALLQTVKNPAPAVSYIVNLLDWTMRAEKLIPGLQYSDTYTTEDWLKSGMKNFPITNEISKWQREAKQRNGR